MLAQVLRRRLLDWYLPAGLALAAAAILTTGFGLALTGRFGQPLLPIQARAAAAPKGGAFRIVALGDSITDGTGDPIGKGYASRVSEALRKNRRIVIFTNLAVGGAETEDVLDGHEEGRGRPPDRAGGSHPAVGRGQRPQPRAAGHHRRGRARARTGSGPREGKSCCHPGAAASGGAPGQHPPAGDLQPARDRGRRRAPGPGAAARVERRHRAGDPCLRRRARRPDRRHLRRPPRPPGRGSIPPRTAGTRADRRPRALDATGSSTHSARSW